VPKSPEQGGGLGHLGNRSQGALKDDLKKAERDYFDVVAFLELD
jgi:hypothetical protein